MNFIFISPNFPACYSHFIAALRKQGINILGIGDTPYNELNDELKQNIVEYCYCWDLSNLQWMKNTIDYLRCKYGQIDYIESNNEYWLESDAQLREYADVPNGMRPHEMDKIKYKSKMKEYFQKAGAKVARYILVSSIEESEKFIDQVGYPVFCKPDNGVGAQATYKINNHDELISFHQSKSDDSYIMEEFIDGELISFDGICDDDSNVVVSFNETFPFQISKVVNENLDLYYYANVDMPEDFRLLGNNVVKTFGIKKRCFHIEFFILNKSKKGLGKKGDYIALETNMRSPGGNTPDLLCLALNKNYYEIYAEVINSNSTSIPLNEKHFIAISVNRKDHYNYIHNEEEIWNKYGEHIKENGYYPDSFYQAMGRRFFFGQFDTIDEALEFQKFVLDK